MFPPLSEGLSSIATVHYAGEGLSSSKGTLTRNQSHNYVYKAQGHTEVWLPRGQCWRLPQGETNRVKKCGCALQSDTGGRAH